MKRRRMILGWRVDIRLSKSINTARCRSCFRFDALHKKKHRHILINNAILIMSTIDPDCMLFRVWANAPIVARQLVKSIPIMPVYRFCRKDVEYNARAVIARQWTVPQLSIMIIYNMYKIKASMPHGEELKNVELFIIANQRQCLSSHNMLERHRWPSQTQ